MGFNAATVARLSAVLPREDVRLVLANATVVDDLAARWKRKVADLFDELNDKALDYIQANGEIPASFGDKVFEAIAETFLKHELETTYAAERSARTDSARLAKGGDGMPDLPDFTPPPWSKSDPMPAKPDLTPPGPSRNDPIPPIKPPLPPREPPAGAGGGGDGGGKPPKWPSDTAKIRALWDRWRKTGKLPGRTRVQAAAVKVLYIRRIQKLTQERAREFIAGKPREIGRDEKGAYWNPDAFDRSSAKKAIEEEAAVSRARASTIIETETTRYYNTTRVNVYNTVDSVVAYYFVCVRDHATTKWCRSRNHAVFTKGTELLRKNTPPCHWNCRSELLPLSRLNPAHRKLLEDASLRAENRVFVPLPPEWNT